MTTLAWDGRTLAADRMVSWSGGRTEATKLWLLQPGGGWFAAAGVSDDVLAGFEWLCRKKRGEKPECRSLDGLIVFPDKSLWVVAAGLHMERMYDRIHALGAGAAYALGAMHCGKSSVEAVEIAAQYSPSTGMGIDEAVPGETKCRTVRRLKLISERV